MNKDHAITAENMVRALPLPLAQDENALALGKATAEVLQLLLGMIRSDLVYPAIDSLPEELLDILAQDYKVDWYDADYTLEEKRKTIKESWAVHRTIGTKAAVEKAISAVYPDTTVQEWFEYDGEPYNFRLRINLTHDSANSERMQRAMDRMNYYKNLRSHNDGALHFFMEPNEEHLAEIDAVSSCTNMRMFVQAKAEIETRAPKGEALAQAGVEQFIRHMTVHTPAIHIM